MITFFLRNDILQVDIVENYCVIKEKGENYVILDILDLGPGKGYSPRVGPFITMFYTFLSGFYQGKQ